MIYLAYVSYNRLDLYYADPAQPLTTAGEELRDLDHDLSELWLTTAGDDLDDLHHDPPSNIPYPSSSSPSRFVWPMLS